MSERTRPPVGPPGGEGRDEPGAGLEQELELARLLPPLDGAHGPARRLSSARTSSMVSAIVDAASAAAPADPAAPPPLSPFDVTRTVIFEPPPARRRVAARGVMVAAALVVASVGSAAAGVWIAMRERPAEPPTATAPAERAPVRRGTPVEREAASAPVGSPDPAPAMDQDPEDRIDQDPIEEPIDEPIDQIEEEDSKVDQKRERKRRERARSRSRSRQESREPAPPEEALPEPEVRREPATVLPADAPVEDIVALANQRRKDKRWRAAEELYERAMRDHAGTDAAAIATVASASLHLDHLDDPAGAQRRFRRALRLRPDGPLAEEARWGLAETQRALGDEPAERTALRAFLSAHPRSVNAGRARQRLTELGARP